MGHLTKLYNYLGGLSLASFGFLCRFPAHILSHPSSLSAVPPFLELLYLPYNTHPHLKNRDTQVLRPNPRTVLRRSTPANMMSSSEATGETSASLQNIPATYARLKRQYQQTLDRITPHIFSRWVGTTVTIAIFELRILYAQGVRVLPNNPAFHRSLQHSPPRF